MHGAEAARASKGDVLELYANKWRHSITQSCSSLAEVLQVSDAVPLQKAIEAAWPFADQVSDIICQWLVLVLENAALKAGSSKSLIEDRKNKTLTLHDFEVIRGVIVQLLAAVHIHVAIPHVLTHYLPLQYSQSVCYASELCQAALVSNCPDFHHESLRHYLDACRHGWKVSPSKARQ